MSTIPWTEKFRPYRLDDMISHEHIIKTLKQFVSKKCIPHMLFHGPPGTGKTSAIMAAAKELYGEYYPVMVMELNASDDRGIEVVRNKIKKFVMADNVFFEDTPSKRKNIFKLVILDETDAMTDDAQAILRQVVEKYTRNARFCLICNYIKKINPALQSRCTSFHFKPLAKADMEEKIQCVINREKIDITPDGVQTVIKRSEGDMRKALNILQTTNMSGETVTDELVNRYVNYPQKQFIETVINNLVCVPYSEAYNNIVNMQKDNGISLSDIVTELHEYLFRHIIGEGDTETDLANLNMEKVPTMLSKMKDIEYNQSINSNDMVQLSALIGIFKTCTV